MGTWSPRSGLYIRSWIALEPLWLGGRLPQARRFRAALAIFDRRDAGPPAALEQHGQAVTKGVSRDVGDIAERAGVGHGRIRMAGSAELASAGDGLGLVVPVARELIGRHQAILAGDLGLVLVAAAGHQDQRGQTQPQASVH